MERRKGERNQKSQALQAKKTGNFKRQKMLYQENQRTSQDLQPKKKQNFKQLEMLHQEDQRTPRRNQKSQALQPKKTQKFKQQKMFHQEDQKRRYPQPPHPPSQPLVDSDLKTENLCLDIVLAVDETGGNKPEAFVDTLPISSLPPCPTTPSLLSIVPYKAPLSSRTRPPSRTINATLSHYWNRKKLATLSNHFNPIPFLREKPSDFATHQLLLTRLGLWNFLHLDFDRNIHSDLIKQLVVYYNPKKPAYGRSLVNGWRIVVSRATLARALALPTKRLNLHGYDAERAAPFMVSEEESLFVEELVSSWLVLRDDSCELPDEVSKVKSLIRERRLEDVDWAGLIWCMVKSELLKGGKLVNCYYASHLQLFLKNQKPRLFGDHVEVVGFLDTDAVVCGEEKVDKNLSRLEGPALVNRCTGLFSEESVKQRILDVKVNAEGVEESGRKQKTETNDLIAVDFDDCKGNKLQEPQTTGTQSPGDFKVELNITTSEAQDHNVVEKVSSENLCTPYQQSSMQKEGGNSELKLLGGEDETKLSTENLFAGNSGELPDNGLEKKLNVDFECNEKECWQGELTELEFGSANDMLMNEHCNDERLRMEHLSDFTASGMHVLSRLESEFEKMDLVSSHDNGEKEFGLDALVEDCRIISEKCSTLDELHAVKIEDGSKELKLLPGENNSKLSNKEVKLLHDEDESKLSEGLVKEEIFDSRTGDLFDSQEKEVNNDSECKKMDYNQHQLNCLHEKYGTDLESVSANNMLMDEEINEERLEAECSSYLSMGGTCSPSRQGTNSHQVDLVLSEDKCEAEFGLNVLVEDHNVIDGEVFTSDEQRAIELEDGNRKPLQNDLSEGLVEDEHFGGKTDELLESREKKVENSILFSSKQHDRKMEDGDIESRLVHGKYENEFSQGLIKEELCDARVGDSDDNQDVEVGFIAEKSTMDSENQHTEIAMEDEKPELLGIIKPETRGLNEILGAELDLQNKSGLKIISFVEPFAVQRESSMNLDYSPLDNSLKREIDCLNDRQFKRLNMTQKITGFNSDAGESFDLDLCSEQVELWVSRLKSAAQKCAQMDKGTNAMLLKEIETKNQIIEQYEIIRRQEQHKYQKNIRRLERELYLMKNILDEYRTALNQVDKSFAEYRKRAQLPEEPIYVDHPDGGGKVVLATELKSLQIESTT